MHNLGKFALTAALLLPLAASPAAAQDYRWDFGVNGGVSVFTDMLQSDAHGLTDFAGQDAVKFRNGWLVGGQLGFYPTPRIGLRANMTYADRPLQGPNVVTTDPSAEQRRLHEHINLWSASGDVLIRFAQPNESWLGMELLPYLALGAGLKFINPAGDDAVFTPVTATETGNTMVLQESSSLMGLVGLGTDVRLAPNFAMRFEVNDRIYRPEVYLVDNGNVTGERVSRVVHEFSGQIGLHVLAGFMTPPPVAVAPLPAPAPVPPPPPAPAPAPAPVEESVMVCVIDPTAPEGVRMQTATYREATRDTVMMVDGQRVPLRDAVGPVTVARTADWYVRGEPLTLQIGAERVEYVRYEGARQIEADRLAYLGTINGQPVFADRDEVAHMMTALNEARAGQPTRDLGQVLAANRALRSQLQGVQYLYVPLEPVGCVFQPLAVMTTVKKD